MSRQPIVNAKFKMPKAELVVVTLATIFCLVVAGLVLSEIFLPPYIDLSALLGGAAFLGLSSYLLTYLIRPGEHEFYARKIKTNSLWRRRLYPKEKIEGYRLIGYREKSKKGKKLVFKIGNRYFTLYDKYYASFPQIVRYAKKHHKELSKTAIKSYTYYFYRWPRLMLLSFFIFLLISGINRSSAGHEPINLELEDIEIQLSTSPKKDYSSGGKKSRRRRTLPTYTFTSKEYPGFQFRIGKSGVRRTNPELMEDFKAGDLISIQIEKIEFDSKLARVAEPDFWTKHFYWFRIDAHALKSESKSYLTYRPQVLARTAGLSLSFSLVFLVLALIPWRNLKL